MASQQQQQRALCGGGDGATVSGSPVRQPGGSVSPQHGSPAAASHGDKSTLKVHLPNGGFNVVRYVESSDIRSIIALVTERMAVGERHYRSMYAMRLRGKPDEKSGTETYWLHQDMTITQIIERYCKKLIISEWRFELRIRYIPLCLTELCEKDKATFHYYYDQVKNDYLNTSLVNSSIEQDVAIQLCCLMIRHFFKDMPQVALDKKSNLEYLEREVGLHKFLPRVVIDAVKPKALRKLIQTQFKKVSSLSEQECMFKFFELLHQHYRYDQELFRVDLGSGWSVPVDLVIAPALGISYMTVQATHPTRIAEFDQIQAVQTLVTDCETHKKAVLQLRVAGAQETLIITCPTIEVAESLADLVDGYCRLTSGSTTSLWNRKGKYFFKSTI